MRSRKLKKYRKLRVERDETKMLVRWGHLFLNDAIVFLPIWLSGWTFGCAVVILHFLFVEPSIIMFVVLIPMLWGWGWATREFIHLYIEKEQFLLNQNGLTTSRLLLFWRWEKFFPIENLCRFEFYFSRQGPATRGVKVLGDNIEEKYEMPIKREEVQRLIRDLNDFLEKIRPECP